MLFEQNIVKRCWVEIDLSQLRENYRIVKEAFPADTQIMGVVKADAYGHGDVVVAQLLEEFGVRLFAVSNIHEAIGLRQAGIVGEILILGYTPFELAEQLYIYDLTQTLLSEEYAEQLSRATEHRLKVQFAIDTGMNASDFTVRMPRLVLRRSASMRSALICGEFSRIFVWRTAKRKRILSLQSGK